MLCVGAGRQAEELEDLQLLGCELRLEGLDEGAVAVELVRATVVKISRIRSVEGALQSRNSGWSAMLSRPCGACRCGPRVR